MIRRAGLSAIEPKAATMMTPKQIPMGLPLPAAMGREDFFVTPANAQALATVESWRNWPQGKLVLTGPEGAGKTHLAHLWATEAAGQVLPARAVLLGDPDALIARTPHIALEDAEALVGLPAAEEALFHLHNMILAAQGRLLITAKTPPARWALGLPDLASRLQATAVVALAPPDDALLEAVLVKLFADRQLQVTPSLIAYLLPRMERSLAAAQTLVADLDRRALAGRRPVTRRLAAEVLDEESGGLAE